MYYIILACYYPTMPRFSYTRILNYHKLGVTIQKHATIGGYNGVPNNIARK